MNSIDTTSPHAVSLADSDSNDLTHQTTSDPAALEMLRAMIGGVVPHQMDLQQAAHGDEDVKNLAGKIQSLLTKALAEESLPSSLASIMTALQGRLSSKEMHLGAAVSSPDLSPDALLSSRQFSNDAIFSPEDLALMKQMLSSMDGAAPSPTANTTLQEIRQELTAALNPAPQAVTESFKVDPIEISPPPPDASSLGHSILHSLGAHSSSVTAPLTHAPSTERVEQVSALMTEMADRVLVTDPLHGQNPEVRISLADNLMPGTDLRVWREGGGQLRVEFDTVSPYWARVLNEASPLLAQRLNDRLGPAEQAAQVTVQQQGGQPEDGRSRNRQSPWELAQQALNS